MALTRGEIEMMAPDKSALQAAAGLLKPAKWPVRARAGEIVWGECQGSGANPYRVAADTQDSGTKCTCPSRKFPCKHALALLWLLVDDPASFVPGEIPDWVTEWRGRRRKPGTAPDAAPRAAAGALDDMITAAAPDPLTEAKRLEAAQKRAAATTQSVLGALAELDLWIDDQLRTGLTGFLAELMPRCRRIAARLADAKAAALASRLDELPARLLALPAEERGDAAIIELGQLVLLRSTWAATPDDPALRREIITAEARDDVLNNPESPHAAGWWEALGERVSTRRDGLVSVATWLLSLEAAGPRFAMLLDFYPASAGRRSGAFAPGERFYAKLCFYPAALPLRAVIDSRDAAPAAPKQWPAAPDDPLAVYAAQLSHTPWALEAPLLLPAGRICLDPAGRHWWRGEDVALPLADPAPPVALGTVLHSAMGLWTGARLKLLAAQTGWGRLGFDG
jgi:hypothetical protein